MWGLSLARVLDLYNYAQSIIVNIGCAVQLSVIAQKGLVYVGIATLALRGLLSPCTLNM